MTINLTTERVDILQKTKTLTSNNTLKIRDLAPFLLVSAFPAVRLFIDIQNV